MRYAVTTKLMRGEKLATNAMQRNGWRDEMFVGGEAVQIMQDELANYFEGK